MRSTPRATGVTSPLAPAPPAEPDSMEQLIGDCRQMAAHWHMPSGERTSAAPAGLHGITVPPASAHVVAGMVEFGD